MNYKGSRRRREKKKWTEKIFEDIIVENFPNMGKEIVNKVQEVQRVPYRINLRRNKQRHILIKLSKIKYKEKILKAEREKPNKIQGKLQSRREWQHIFKVMKGKNLRPRLFYPARISFRFDRENKTFTDKKKLREFNTTKRASQQMLKEIF